MHVTGNVAFWKRLFHSVPLRHVSIARTLVVGTAWEEWNTVLHCQTSLTCLSFVMPFEVRFKIQKTQSPEGSCAFHFMHFLVRVHGELQFYRFRMMQSQWKMASCCILFRCACITVGLVAVSLAVHVFTGRMRYVASCFKLSWSSSYMTSTLLAWGVSAFVQLPSVPLVHELSLPKICQEESLNEFVKTELHLSRNKIDLSVTGVNHFWCYTYSNY